MVTAIYDVARRWGITPQAARLFCARHAPHGVRNIGGLSVIETADIPALTEQRDLRRRRIDAGTNSPTNRGRAAAARKRRETAARQRRIGAAPRAPLRTKPVA